MSESSDEHELRHNVTMQIAKHTFMERAQLREYRQYLKTQKKKRNPDDHRRSFPTNMSDQIMITNQSSSPLKPNMMNKNRFDGATQYSENQFQSRSSSISIREA
jgi:hypothetical protein